MHHGQVVVGPPGAGKSTYCRGVRLFHGEHTDKRLRRRRVFLVSLDPAADPGDEPADVDVCELVSVAKVMEDEELGPNGALLAALDILEASVDSWLLPRLQACVESAASDECAPYFVFDTPGQVETTTCHSALARVLVRLQRAGFSLAVVHLADATHCADAHRFVALVLVTLRAMLFLACPQINVLSKVDLVRAVCGDLPLPLAYYLDADVAAVVGASGGEDARFAKLSAALAELAADARLVSFVPLAVQDRDCMALLQMHVDRATGWAFDVDGPVLAISAALGSMEVAEERIVELVTERYLEASPASEDYIHSQRITGSDDSASDASEHAE